MEYFNEYIYHHYQPKIIQLYIITLSFYLIFPNIKIFGLSFILHVLHLSGQHDFWKNLRNTDITTHKSAISYQKILQKYVKAKLVNEFLKKCKSIGVYPKFFRWKNVKNKTKEEKNKLYNANLTIPAKLATMISDRYKNNLLTRKINSVNQQRGWNTIAVHFPLIVYSLRKLI